MRRALHHLAAQCADHLGSIARDVAALRAALTGKRPRGLGPCDLLTVEEACRVLRMGVQRGRPFLVKHGLIRYFDGEPRVVAAELVKAHDAAEVEAAPVRAVVPLRRARLA